MISEDELVKFEIYSRTPTDDWPGGRTVAQLLIEELCAELREARESVTKTMNICYRLEERLASYESEELKRLQNINDFEAGCG